LDDWKRNVYERSKNVSSPDWKRKEQLSKRIAQVLKNSPVKNEEDFRRNSIKGTFAMSRTQEELKKDFDSVIKRRETTPIKEANFEEEHSIYSDNEEGDEELNLTKKTQEETQKTEWRFTEEDKGDKTEGFQNRPKKYSFSLPPNLYEETECEGEGELFIPNRRDSENE
jgi:hypothetical protein